MRWFPLLIVSLALAALPVPGFVAAQELALVHANVVDVTTGEVISDATIVVRGGKIQSVTPGSTETPEGSRVLDLQGMYVSPGLMDAHVHISDAQAARRALRSGVTTARSMGTSNYADVGLRELAASGRIDAPEMLATGYHVRPEMAGDFYLNHPDDGDLMEEGVHGADAVRRVARRILARDVDFVKTNATERAGLPDTDPRKQLYSRAELEALVEEAGARGVGVAAHAHGDDGIRAAVLAGVRSIEHGTFMTDETLEVMAERGTYLVPTMAIVTDLTVPGGDYDSPILRIRGRYMVDRMREMVARAHAMGIRVVASTDTGYGPGSTVRIGHELEEFAGVGMSPLEALRAATTVAADLLGVEDHTGRIEAGLDADLVVTERNPLDDIRALQDVLLVVSDGRVVATRGDWFDDSSETGDAGGGDR